MGDLAREDWRVTVNDPSWHHDLWCYLDLLSFKPKVKAIQSIRMPIYITHLQIQILYGYFHKLLLLLHFLSGKMWSG